MSDLGREQGVPGQVSGSVLVLALVAAEQELATGLGSAMDWAPVAKGPESEKDSGLASEMAMGSAWVLVSEQAQELVTARAMASTLPVVLEQSPGVRPEAARWCQEQAGPEPRLRVVRERR